MADFIVNFTETGSNIDVGFEDTTIITLGVQSVTAASGETVINVDNTDTANPKLSSKITTTQGNVTLTKEADGLKANVADNALTIAKTDGLQSALDSKAASVHTHDDRYYTETEVNNLLANKVTQQDLAQGLATRMVVGSVSASATGTSTNEVNYLSIEGTEYKLPSGGSGEPDAYIKNASVSGNTLTLIKKDNSTVTFTDTDTTYNAGNNITINGTTISATDTTYSAGVGLTLTNNQFAVNTTTIATQQDLQQGLATRSAIGHDHDDRYYTETETNTLLTVLTTAPTEDNTSGLIKAVYLESEPATKYNGYIYMIKE